ncbi:hypothetical protein ACFOMD_18145 [Sphingoaurantiacus capsulatus]|uniref:Porin n=1 Tax=Sphingoaurantiacus capsulatus TaxID=1771310 RepID=A0ABV7XID0_9SPHN
MAGKLATGWLVAAALISAPATAFANPTPAKTNASAVSVPKAKKAKVKVVAEATAAERLRAGSLGSFTPSLVDPARSAAIRSQTVERSFRFTPSGKSTDRKALTLGLTSRVMTPATRTAVASIDGLTPTGYNLGVAVGYEGFSLSGGYSRQENGLLGGEREGVDLGLSYRGSRWKASLQASGELPSHLAGDILPLDKRYAVELGGAYALTPRLSLQGGMRYQLITPLDPRLTNEREDPSVYVGTSFRF